MESNKYYKPEIKEFNVGFEYERNQYQNGVWYKYVVEERDILDHNEKEIRVKYLDKKDIEEILEVKQLKGNKSELNFQLIINDNLFYEIDYDVDTKELVVEKYVEVYEDTYNSYTLFKGIVKNKSKLKTVLKDIRIIN